MRDDQMMEAPAPFRTFPVTRLGLYNVKVSISDGPMYVIVYWPGREEEQHWREDAKTTVMVATFDDELKAKAFMTRLVEEV